MSGEERFYVYRIFDGFQTLYVGKGSGRRLTSQKSKYRASGEIIRRFRSERAAFAYEIEMIATLLPILNKHPGGNGARVLRKRVVRPKWLRDMERIGTRVYVARALLRLKLPDSVSPEKIQMLREVAASAPF